MEILGGQLASNEPLGSPGLDVHMADEGEVDENFNSDSFFSGLVPDPSNGDPRSILNDDVGDLSAAMEVIAEAHRLVEDNDVISSHVESSGNSPFHSIVKTDYSDPVLNDLNMLHGPNPFQSNRHEDEEDDTKSEHFDDSLKSDCDLPDALISPNDLINNHLQNNEPPQPRQQLPKITKALSISRNIALPLSFNHNWRLILRPIFEKALIELLRSSGELGASSPQALLLSMWFFISRHFGIGCRTDHARLAFGNFVVTINPETGLKQLNFIRTSKGAMISVSARKGPKDPKVCAPAVRPRNPDHTVQAIPSRPDLCPVNLFEVFCSHRPCSANLPESPFYLQPERGANLSNTDPTGVWYTSNALGKNKIGSMLNCALQNTGMPITRQVSLIRFSDALAATTFTAASGKVGERLRELLNQYNCGNPSSDLEQSMLDCANQIMQASRTPDTAIYRLLLKECVVKVPVGESTGSRSKQCSNRSKVKAGQNEDSIAMQSLASFGSSNSRLSGSGMGSLVKRIVVTGQNDHCFDHGHSLEEAVNILGMDHVQSSTNTTAGDTNRDMDTEISIPKIKLSPSQDDHGLTNIFDRHSLTNQQLLTQMFQDASSLMNLNQFRFAGLENDDSHDFPSLFDLSGCQSNLNTGEIMFPQNENQSNPTLHPSLSDIHLIHSNPISGPSSLGQLPNSSTLQISPGSRTILLVPSNYSTAHSCLDFASSVTSAPTTTRTTAEASTTTTAMTYGSVNPISSSLPLEENMVDISRLTGIENLIPLKLAASTPLKPISNLQPTLPINNQHQSDGKTGPIETCTDDDVFHPDSNDDIRIDLRKSGGGAGRSVKLELRELLELVLAAAPAPAWLSLADNPKGPTCTSGSPRPPVGLVTQLLWRSKALDARGPWILTFAMWWLMQHYFGIGSRMHHVRLRWGHVRLVHDVIDPITGLLCDAVEYIGPTEFTTVKACALLEPVEDSHMGPRFRRVYPSSGWAEAEIAVAAVLACKTPDERPRIRPLDTTSDMDPIPLRPGPDFVSLYKAFAAHRQRSSMHPESPFYVQPVFQITTSGPQNRSSSPWFSVGALGKNRIGALMRNIVDKVVRPNLSRVAAAATTAATQACTMAARRAAFGLSADNTEAPNEDLTRRRRQLLDKLACLLGLNLRSLEKACELDMKTSDDLLKPGVNMSTLPQTLPDSNEQRLPDLILSPQIPQAVHQILPTETTPVCSKLSPPASASYRSVHYVTNHSVTNEQDRFGTGSSWAQQNSPTGLILLTTDGHSFVTSAGSNNQPGSLILIPAQISPEQKIFHHHHQQQQHLNQVIQQQPQQHHSQPQHHENVPSTMILHPIPNSNILTNPGNQMLQTQNVTQRSSTQQLAYLTHDSSGTALPVNLILLSTSSSPIFSSISTSPTVISSLSNQSHQRLQQSRQQQQHTIIQPHTISILRPQSHHQQQENCHTMNSSCSIAHNADCFQPMTIQQQQTSTNASVINTSKSVTSLFNPVKAKVDPTGDQRLSSSNNSLNHAATASNIPVIYSPLLYSSGTGPNLSTLNKNTQLSMDSRSVDLIQLSPIKECQRTGSVLHAINANGQLVAIAQSEQPPTKLEEIIVQTENSNRVNSPIPESFVSLENNNPHSHPTTMCFETVADEEILPSTLQDGNTEVIYRIYCPDNFDTLQSIQSMNSNVSQSGCLSLNLMSTNSQPIRTFKLDPTENNQSQTVGHRPGSSNLTTTAATTIMVKQPINIIPTSSSRVITTQSTTKTPLANRTSTNSLSVLPPLVSMTCHLVPPEPKPEQLRTLQSVINSASAFQCADFPAYVEQLFRKGILSGRRPWCLNFTAWFINTLVFEVENRTEHVSLRWGDFRLCKTADGQTEYIYFINRVTNKSYYLAESKSRSPHTLGFVKSMKDDKYVDDYDLEGNPIRSPCPVVIFKALRNHRPAGCLEPYSKFYLQPRNVQCPDADDPDQICDPLAKQHPLPPNSNWFTEHPWGKNKLGCLFAQASKLAGLPTIWLRKHRSRNFFPGGGGSGMGAVSTSACGTTYTTAMKVIMPTVTTTTTKPVNGDHQLDNVSNNPSNLMRMVSLTASPINSFQPSSKRRRVLQNNTNDETSGISDGITTLSSGKIQDVSNLVPQESGSYLFPSSVC